MIYQADWLLSLNGPPLPGGWLEIEADIITAVGPGSNLHPGKEVRKLVDCILLPGLINAHCHLELTSLKDRLPSGKSFPVWVEELRGFTAAFNSENYQRAAKKGVLLLLKGGATTVVDVGNTGDALVVLSKSPMRSFALVETLGLDPSLAESRFAFAKKMAEGIANDSRYRSGVTPHAAYSCSPELLSKTAQYQIGRHLPLSIHASESREEAELFASASGPLQDYCRRIFSRSPEHRNTTPIQWLESLNLLPDGALIVHGNHLDEKDMAILSDRKASVVHCPSSHAFFGHRPLPYSQLREHGIPVCLGTDSLASGDSLSMLDQIRLFRKNFPVVSAEESLRMATSVAAQALGLGDELGILKPGYKADFIALRHPANKNPYEAVLNPDMEVALSVIGGREAG